MNECRNKINHKRMIKWTFWRVKMKASWKMLLILLIPILLVFSDGLAQKKPNILLIISDDQKWSDYGFMGHQEIRTPHLDRLSSEGILFTRGYVPVSLCRPSLASIITGLYPHQHQIVGNDPYSPEKQRGSAEYQELNEQVIS